MTKYRESERTSEIEFEEIKLALAERDLRFQEADPNR